MLLTYNFKFKFSNHGTIPRPLTRFNPRFFITLNEIVCILSILWGLTRQHSIKRPPYCTQLFVRSVDAINSPRNLPTVFMLDFSAAKLAPSLPNGSKVIDALSRQSFPFLRHFSYFLFRRFSSPRKFFKIFAAQMPCDSLKFKNFS